MVRRTIITSTLALLVTLGSMLVAIPHIYAQQQICFSETGHCIQGRFGQYWQQNGGLMVFGYPLTDELTENNATVQYFERQRFELHPENSAPYDVLLGLLGDEALGKPGSDWHTLPVASGPQTGCLWFAETQHNVCDQAPGVGFKSYWQSHGLSFDGQAGFSYQESLALFGLPISEVMPATLNGETYNIQWFERARFEWHPENANPYQVLLGRLGADSVTAQPTPQPPREFSSQESPNDVLASFYNAINRQEYQRAYGYWESPPSDFQQFAQGYADTTSVQVIVQPPTFIDAGAGNLHAAIKTVLIATHHDSSIQAFYGCYTTHKANIQPDVWHLAQAQIAQVDLSDPNNTLPALLDRACSALSLPSDAQVSYDNRDTPIDLLAAFYNAINRKDYARAYAYWENPPSTFQQFEQGYANTSSVQFIVQLPAFVDIGAGNAHANISTVLIATQLNGSKQVFSGCYTAHKVNIQPDVWHISSATITEANPNLSIPRALAQACPAL